MGRLPTVADVRAKKLEVTRAAVREAIEAGDLEAYRGVARALAEEFDLLDVAAAAVKLAHEPGDGEEETAPAEDDAPTRDSFAPGEMARVFVGAGRLAGVRPKDLVGAITKGAGVAAEALGAIEIADRFSVVEVRATEAKALIESLRKTPLRGHKVAVRPWDDGGGERPKARPKAGPRHSG